MEYTVTHQFFLSRENTVYLLCFDASLGIEQQKEHINYWLQYLDSLLVSGIPQGQHASFKVIIVGLRCEVATSVTTTNLQAALEASWGHLPLYKQIFSVSSYSNIGISTLKETVFSVCKEMRGACKHVPYFPWLLYQHLEGLRERTKLMMTVNELHAKIEAEVKLSLTIDQLEGALEYFHNEGKVVKWNKWICLSPELLGHMMASFVSPEEVREKILEKKPGDEVRYECSGSVLIFN